MSHSTGPRSNRSGTKASRHGRSWRWALQNDTLVRPAGHFGIGDRIGDLRLDRCPITRAPLRAEGCREGAGTGQAFETLDARLVTFGTTSRHASMYHHRPFDLLAIDPSTPAADDSGRLSTGSCVRAKVGFEVPPGQSCKPDLPALLSSNSLQWSVG